MDPDQNIAGYLEMSTEEICDRADEGDLTARAIIKARFMEYLEKNDDETRVKDTDV